MDPEERAGYVAELRESRDVRRELNGCWPPLRPERLVRDLFAQPWRLESAGAPTVHTGACAAGPAAVARRGRRPTSPLLDEAAELLGSEETAPAPAGPSAELEYAREVLRDSPAAGMVSAEQLAAALGRRSRCAGRWPSTRPATASGRTGTWSWTRRRSCRR